MKHLSWKYVAGLVDGEGCIDFQVCKQPNKLQPGLKYWSLTPRLRVSLSSNCGFLLEQLSAQCPGSHILRYSRAHENPNWSSVVTFQLENAKVRAPLQLMLPFMYLKREQARFMIWYIDNLLGKRANMERYENIVAARQIAHAEMKLLKRDPQRLSEKAAAQVTKTLHVGAIVQAA